MSIDWWLTNKQKPDSEKTQGSKKWQEWRGKGLGSSDAPALLGLSPWSNPEQLFLEKTGRFKKQFSQQQRNAMARGTKLEPYIRDWYERKVNAQFPDDIAEHHFYNFIRVSYDGINRSLREIIEIKAPNRDDHELAANGIVPPKYYPQCQWQLGIAGTGYKLTYISFGTDEKYHTVEVLPDVPMINALEHRAIMMWGMIQADKFDPTQFPVYSRSLDLDLSGS